MNKETIFHLNRLADEHDALSKAYRIVANDMMNGQPAEHRAKPATKKGVGPIRSFKGKHWMQQPENRDRMLRVIRKMHRAKKRKRLGK